MSNDNPDYFFFDIGGTLGTVQLSVDGNGIERIEVFPGVIEVLEILEKRGATMGLISNPGSISEKIVTTALDACGLLQFFKPALTVFGVKDSTAIFLKAVGLAGEDNSPQNCFFVGENEAERNFAQLAGMRTASSPSEAIEFLHS